MTYQSAVLRAQAFVSVCSVPLRAPGFAPPPRPAQPDSEAQLGSTRSCHGMKTHVYPMRHIYDGSDEKRAGKATFPQHAAEPSQATPRRVTPWGSSAVVGSVRFLAVSSRFFFQAVPFLR